MIIQDGDWRLVEHDLKTGRSVWRYDDGQMTHFRTDYPVQNIIQDNQAFYKDSAGQRFGDGQRIASIPLNIFYDQLEEAHAQGDRAYVNRWLNDSDNRAFRTFDGQA